MYDHFVKIKIGKQDLSEDKNPPICDGCNASFDEEEDGMFEVRGLILGTRIANDIDYSLWGLICDDCKKRYHSHVQELPPTEAERRTIHAVLGRDVSVISVDSIGDFPFN